LTADAAVRVSDLSASLTVSPSVRHQEIECKEARFSPMEEQVIKLWPAASIETYNFPVEHSLAVTRRSQFFAEFSE
jgi:hypothetical protein